MEGGCEMNFLKSVKSEIGKMSWLSKKEVWGQFLAVHVIAGAILIYFIGIDFVVSGIKNLF